FCTLSLVLIFDIENVVEVIIEEHWYPIQDCNQPEGEHQLEIYENGDYIMAEWHIYASGPNEKPGGQKYWKKNGTDKGRDNVKLAIEPATNFTRDRLCNAGVPWSLNALDRYYDTKEKRWLKEKQEIKERSLNISEVLEDIRDVMLKDPKACY
ncbi:unnamed protein product, partial [Porites lobata]